MDNGERHSGAYVLVVDDDSSIVRLLTRTLQSAGYTNIHGITDSAEVPLLLESITPDLVVLDLNMPGMDGFALLRDIQSRLPQDSFMPVLTVSGLADAESKEKAFSMGAKDYLVKPLALSEFVLHVNSLLETRFLSLRLKETQEHMAELVGRRTEQTSSERHQAPPSRGGLPRDRALFRRSPQLGAPGYVELGRGHR